MAVAKKAGKYIFSRHRQAGRAWNGKLGHVGIRKEGLKEK
jgi:hypothetical protein